jgi:hypothetical protein
MIEQIVALHLYAGLRYLLARLLVVCLFLTVCFGLGGLLRPSFFSLFSVAVMSLFLGFELAVASDAGFAGSVSGDGREL